MGLAVLISAMLAEEPTPELKSSRKPKVYLISTTTSTTTLSTSSVCFIIFSTANGLVSCKKKKRSIGFLEDKPVDVDDTQSELIAPTLLLNHKMKKLLQSCLKLLMLLVERMTMMIMRNEKPDFSTTG